MVIARDLLEDADELLADHAPLPLRIGDPGQLREEPVLRLHVDERNAEVTAEGLLHLIRLSVSVQPVVDEDAGELIADRTVDEERRDGGVDPAGERAQDLGLTDLLPDPGHRILHDVHRGPVGQEPAAVVEEPLQHVLSPRCVRHLGVELDREQTSLRILHRRDRDLVGASGHAEALGRTRDRVPVAHPDLLLPRQVGEEHTPRLVDRQAWCRRTRAGRWRRPLLPACEPSVDARSRCRGPARPCRTDPCRPWARPPRRPRRALPRGSGRRDGASRAAPPSRRAARSRSTRAPPGRAGRSAARTAPPGRRPGPVVRDRSVRIPGPEPTNAPSPPAVRPGTSCPRS